MLYGPGTVSLLDVESALQVVGLELLFGSGAFWSSLNGSQTPLRPWDRLDVSEFVQ